MNDIERRITTFLHEEAHRASLPHEVYQRVLRRAKLRRLVTATVAGVAVVAVVMGGIVTAGALRTPQPPSPIGPAESPTPQDQETGPRTVVAQGTIEGQTWRLVAYDNDSALCVDLEIGSGSGGGCGFDVPGRRDLGLNVGSQRGLARTIVHGIVSKRVGSLVVTVDDGERLELDVIPSGDDFNVNFFVGFLPPDASGVIEARSDQGTLLQKERLRPLSQFRDQKVFTEDVLDDQKLTVYYPKGWNRAPDPLISGVDQRTELLSLATYPMIPGRQDCVDLPEEAIESLDATDAFLTLQEAPSTSGFSPRPKDFSTEQGEIPENAECLNNAEGIFFRVFPFRDEGRFFLAYVALGNSASAEKRHELWEILNALIICDPGSPPGDCL